MNDLDQLKELLFGAEKEALDSIAERVGRREVRTVDVADILPEAIHQSHRNDNELVESLSAPVGECLQREFRDDPETYGDALYPVMGPAIRKSIMHALRNFSQQINEAVEHSISPKGLKWRWQASRAGVPFGEYVLQQTMRYRVEQAYLISRENGLLVGHVHHEASKIKDSDAVSAMFTAIQDFVKESFSPDRTGRLESADMGEFTLWAVHGPHALLVCVIRGVPPKALRADLSAILERIHFRYGEAIRDYKGDTSSVPDVEVELERCLKFEAREEQRSTRRGPSIVMLILLLLLLAAAVFAGVRSWQLSQKQQQLENALLAAPGIHVTDVERTGGNYLVRGLADPLARSVTDIAESVDIPAQRIMLAVQPFQSLQPEILEARAAQIFGQPGSVRFEVSDTTLRVIGDAPWAWRQQLQSRFGNLVGVDTLDLTSLSTSDRQEIADRIDALSAKKFYFSNGIDLTEVSRDELIVYSRDVRELLDAASIMGYSVDVVAIGSTDSAGRAATNAVLARRRAETVANVLTKAGIASRAAARPPVATVESEASNDSSQRYAQVDLQLRSPSEVP